MYRRRYKEWALPKGKLENDEDPIDAAFREVREETGYDATSIKFLGTTFYSLGAASKLVLFWLMTPASKSDFQPSEEIERVEWLPIEDAINRLDHDEERELVRKLRHDHYDPRSPQSRSRPAARRPARSETTAALSAEVERLQVQLDALDYNTHAQGWAGEAIALLVLVRGVLVRQSRNHNRVHEAWGWALEARRKLVYTMDQSQVQAEAIALHEEAAHKLYGWRKEATLRLVSQVLDDHPDGIETSSIQKLNKLERALRIRDEHTQNSYRDAVAVRRRLLTLASVTSASMVGVGVMAALVDLGDAAPDAWPAALLVFCFGLLGGSISAFRPLSDSGRRFPEELARWYLTLTRPLVGAGAALALYPFLLAGFVPIELDSFASVAALSVAAGFSERTLSRAVAAVAGRGE